MKLQKCECGNEFEMPEMPKAESELAKRLKRVLVDGAVCDDCEERRWPKTKSEPQKWSLICPAGYRNTDAARLNQPMLAKVKGWKFGSKGLGLLGPSAGGKSRMMYCLLKREHDAGRSIVACTGTEFALKMADIDRRVEFLHDCTEAKILFLDDIDKAKFTERVESDLMHVIESRTSRLKPIMFAVNASGSDLEAMLSENRGEPIVRRLREFCGILIVGTSARAIAQPKTTTSTH